MSDIERLKGYINELSSSIKLINGRLCTEAAKDMLVTSECISALLTSHLIKHKFESSCKCGQVTTIDVVRSIGRTYGPEG